MFDLQTHFIFPTHAVPRAGPLPRGAQQLGLETPDGATLRGLLLPPDDPQPTRTLSLMCQSPVSGPNSGKNRSLIGLGACLTVPIRPSRSHLAASR